MKKQIPVILVILLFLTTVLPLASCSSPKDDSKITIFSTDQEYTVSLEGKVQAVIPANTLAKGTSVAIEELSELKDFNFGGFVPVGLYDISASDASEFANDLTLEFNYTKENLDSTLDAAIQLAVAYYDETYNMWQEVDFKVDDANSKVIVTTNHLSLWSIFVKEEKYITLTAPHFTIYFNKDAKAPAIGPITSGDPLYEYAVLVRTALYDAYEAYDTLGLNLPDNTRVYIDDWGADKEAEWGWFSKNIEIPVTYIDEKELKMVVAHEVFHAVQNQYISFNAMNTDRWWIEATADYAAAHVATSYGLKEKLAPTYLARGINDKETFHNYATAHFVKYLVDSGLDFKDMFSYTMTQPGGALANLANYCVSQGTPLPEIYNNFAYSVLFENSVNTANPGTDIYTDLANQKVELDLEKTRANTSLVNVGSNYAAGLLAVKIINSTTEEIELPIKAVEATSGIKVTYITAKGPGKTDLVEGGILDNNPVTVKVEGGDYLYFLATNYSPSAGSVTIAIGEQSDMQPYNNSRTASVYDNKFKVDVEFNLLANQAFTISQEVVNGDMLALRLDFNKSAKDIIIDVEAIVSNLRFSVPEDWGEEREPVFNDTYWATAQGNITGTQTQITLPQDDARGMLSFGYEIVIDIHNKAEDTYHWGGGAAVILVTVRIMG